MMRKPFPLVMAVTGSCFVACMLVAIAVSTRGVLQPVPAAHVMQPSHTALANTVFATADPILNTSPLLAYTNIPTREQTRTPTRVPTRTPIKTLVATETRKATNTAIPTSTQTTEPLQNMAPLIVSVSWQSADYTEEQVVVFVTDLIELAEEYGYEFVTFKNIDGANKPLVLVLDGLRFYPYDEAPFTKLVTVLREHNTPAVFGFPTAGERMMLTSLKLLAKELIAEDGWQIALNSVTYAGIAHPTSPHTQGVQWEIGFSSDVLSAKYNNGERPNVLIIPWGMGHENVDIYSAAQLYKVDTVVGTEICKVCSEFSSIEYYQAVFVGYQTPATVMISLRVIMTK
jgi:hypothetical protein